MELRPLSVPLGIGGPEHGSLVIWYYFLKCDCKPCQSTVLSIEKRVVRQGVLLVWLAGE